MEFKTKTDYDNFLKGNEEHIASKMQAGKFELFSCNAGCYSKFDNKKERDEHLTNNHRDLTFDDVSSGQWDDSDFKNGGDVFDTLICDLCDKKKTSVFKSFKGGWVSCSDCMSKEENI